MIVWQAPPLPAPNESFRPMEPQLAMPGPPEPPGPALTGWGVEGYRPVQASIPMPGPWADAAFAAGRGGRLPEAPVAGPAAFVPGGGMPGIGSAAQRINASRGGGIRPIPETLTADF